MLVATLADLTRLLPGVTSVPEATRQEYLADAGEHFPVANAWSSARVHRIAQALIALHWMAALGVFATYMVEDPGEVGEMTSRSVAGGSSTSWAATTREAADADLSSTRWGRRLLELKRGNSARRGPILVGR